MNKVTNTIPEITQNTPPEFPPDFPFPPPPQEPKPAAVHVPMIYVDERERAEYVVKEYDSLDAGRIESELNELGKKGWLLTQAISQEKRILLILSRMAGK